MNDMSDARVPVPAPTVLFVLAHAGFLRNFEEVIALLCSAGAHVHVHFSKRHETIELSDYEFVRPTSSNPTFSWSETSGLSARLVERTRVVRDAIFYSQPDFRGATHLRRRFCAMQKANLLSPATVARLLTMFDRMPRLLKRAADHALRLTDAWLPASARAADLIGSLKPAVVVVSPLVNFSSREVDVVKAARRRQIPTVLAVASWDNLTNKGVIKFQPDHVAVWNRHMKAEAVRLHRVPAARIWITGAPLFDRWFARAPSRDRAAFLRHVGLDPSSRLILYCCSSASIAGPAEEEIVARWLEAIRTSGHPLLAAANVIVRPHPMEVSRWQEVRDNPLFSDIWHKARVWPLAPKHPTTEAGRADFFDALSHADAVVGLNTSVMIEAAILGKPVLTFLGHAASETQTANLHFRYLIECGGVRQAADLATHARQLADALADPSGSRESSDRFISDFIRPWGRSVSASQALVQRIQRFIDPSMSYPSGGPKRPSGGVGKVAARWKSALANSAAAHAVVALGVEDRQVLLRALSRPRKLSVTGSNLLFHVHSVTEDARVRKFKEPWTVEWIRSLPDGAVLYDIGANIGVTALLATEDARRNIRVVAIEPFPANYASLVRNIAANGMHARVFPLPIGLGRETAASTLHWANDVACSSLHSFGNFVSLDGRTPIEVAGSHCCICYRLDDLVRVPGLPHPTHLKIDVDGAELEVLGGARSVLRDERCRGLQLELTDQGRREQENAVEILHAAGFSLAATYAHRDPRVCDMQFIRR